MLFIYTIVWYKKAKKHQCYDSCIRVFLHQLATMTTTTALKVYPPPSCVCVVRQLSFATLVAKSFSVHASRCAPLLAIETLSVQHKACIAMERKAPVW